MRAVTLVLCLSAVFASASARPLTLADETVRVVPDPHIVVLRPPTHVRHEWKSAHWPSSLNAEALLPHQDFSVFGPDDASASVTGNGRHFVLVRLRW